MNTYFIADLHLSENTPDLIQSFRNFAKNLIPNDKLYILGDLFDYFVDLFPENTSHIAIKEIVQDLASRNIETFFILGNRDFLLTSKQASFFGFKLLNDISIINIANQKILLVHGDELCAEKFSYKFFRSFSRVRFFQKIFHLITSTKKKINIAKNMRRNSQRRFKENHCRKVQINLPISLSLLHKYQATILIHGHTHQVSEKHVNDYAIYDTGDWNHEKFSYIKVSELGTISVHEEKI
ncbi:MAG: UDP-2,3-diacylglucosamine diphosphatase [Succinivibrionaceae bacterium]|nr:UDP-2,3-diacylglucosamine diphosphatase [Succinivibrionaceae bacterium]